MHLKFGYFVLYTLINRLTEKNVSMLKKNCPCGTVDAKIGYVLGLLVHGNVVVHFGMKIFLVDCLL